MIFSAIPSGIALFYFMSVSKQKTHNRAIVKNRDAECCVRE